MARQQKLKVFRTPIGFHDAYVAAPSRKAALAAWGSDADLFARGVAELVTDDELSREPLENPGKVIRRLRGTAAEQLAALPANPPGREAAPAPSRAGRAKTAPPTKPKPRPSRKKLDAAEQALAANTVRQEQELAEIRERQRALDRERHALEDRHERERHAAEQAVEKQRKLYAEQLAK